MCTSGATWVFQSAFCCCSRVPSISKSVRLNRPHSYFPLGAMVWYDFSVSHRGHRALWWPFPRSSYPGRCANEPETRSAQRSCGRELELLSLLSGSSWNTPGNIWLNGLSLLRCFQTRLLRTPVLKNQYTRAPSGAWWTHSVAVPLGHQTAFEKLVNMCCEATILGTAV